MQQAKRFLVSGAVQGVGYRFFARRAAERLRLSGWVKNLRDGRVEVYALGDAASLEALKRELERGPRGAFVSDVEAGEAEVEPGHARGFTIEFDR